MSDKAGGDSLKITHNGGVVMFGVKIVPAGSKTSVEGLYDGMLKVKVSAPPERGKANQALIDFLADRLGIKKKFIKIVSGQTSKVKQIAAEQITAEELAEKLRNLL